MKIKKTIYQNLLKVEITVPEAEYVTDIKIKINTEEVLGLVESPQEYKIIETIKEGCTITNFLKGPKDTNTSSWIFLISLKEDKISNYKNNTRRKASFRGRISKIAKDIEQKED
tara:strand:+ start:1213 stop:1554 length:342 start_codon:yes stop_codon:yes gene_type:complete